MGINEQITYWKKLSDYDIITAKHMFLTKRYPYCLYMCHLSVEKMLKSLVMQKINRNPPFSHNLIALAKELDITFDEVQKNLLADLTEFNIEARYPEWKKEFYKKANKKYTQIYFIHSQKLQKWLKKFLKK
jgi:HEPN domain-containing protein